MSYFVKGVPDLWLLCFLFNRKAHRSVRCVYNHIADCEGHVKIGGVEDRAGMLSFVCGEGRKGV